MSEKEVDIQPTEAEQDKEKSPASPQKPEPKEQEPGKAKSNTIHYNGGN